jgi:2-keto-4-pentenoate hydratase
MERELARSLVSAMLSKKKTLLPLENLPKSIDEAYRVQDMLKKTLTSEHGYILSGWKVGLTNLPIQQKVGATEPMYGPIFSQNILRPSTFYPCVNKFRGIEAEFVVEMADHCKPLPSNKPYVVADLLERNLIKSVRPGVEICATRFDTSAPPLYASICDQGQHCGLIVSKSSISPSEFVRYHGESHKIQLQALNEAEQGVVLSTGTSSDVLGDPLEAVAWLSNALISSGRYLKAGDLVSTGTMTGMTTFLPPPPTAASKLGSSFDNASSIYVSFPHLTTFAVSMIPGKAEDEGICLYYTELSE